MKDVRYYQERKLYFETAAQAGFTDRQAQFLFENTHAINSESPEKPHTSGPVNDSHTPVPGTDERPPSRHISWDMYRALREAMRELLDSVSDTNDMDQAALRAEDVLRKLPEDDTKMANVEDLISAEIAYEAYRKAYRKWMNPTRGGSCTWTRYDQLAPKVKSAWLASTFALRRRISSDIAERIAAETAERCAGIAEMLKTETPARYAADAIRKEFKLR